VPGSGFGRGSYMRLSLTISAPEIERSLAGFERAIRKARAKWRQPVERVFTASVGYYHQSKGRHPSVSGQQLMYYQLFTEIHTNLHIDKQEGPAIINSVLMVLWLEWSLGLAMRSFPCQSR